MSALVRAVPAALGTQPEAAPIKPNLELRLAQLHARTVASVTSGSHLVCAFCIFVCLLLVKQCSYQTIIY